MLKNYGSVSPMRSSYTVLSDVQTCHTLLHLSPLHWALPEIITQPSSYFLQRVSIKAEFTDCQIIYSNPALPKPNLFYISLLYYLVIKLPWIILFICLFIIYYGIHSIQIGAWHSNNYSFERMNTEWMNQWVSGHESYKKQTKCKITCLDKTQF